MSEGTRQGGCRCGKVRFEVTGSPMLTMACHCTGCQRMTASAFSLSEAYSPPQFRLVEGEVVIGGIHGPAHHYHCDYCKSWIYTDPGKDAGFVNLRSTMFDDPIQEPPFAETYTSEGLSWATTGAVHSFGKFPPMELWPNLIQDYAARPAAMKEATS